MESVTASSHQVGLARPILGIVAPSVGAGTAAREPPAHPGQPPRGPLPVGHDLASIREDPMSRLRWFELALCVCVAAVAPRSHAENTVSDKVDVSDKLDVATYLEW